MQMKSPIQEVYKVLGRDVFVIREDKRFEHKQLPNHAKMGALNELCKWAELEGYTSIGCLCTSHGIWPFGLRYLARENNLSSIVCFPANSMDKVPEELFSFSHGYKLKLLKPNMVTINGAQARAYIERKGGYYIPFGVEEPLVIDYLSRQIKLHDCGTLIVPCGSGVTLAGILRSIRLNETKIKRIEAIPAHAPRAESIAKTVLKYEMIPVNLNWRTVYKYDDIPEIICPWEAHPYYELKAYDWLYKNVDRLPEPIYFFNIGAIK